MTRVVCINFGAFYAYLAAPSCSIVVMEGDDTMQQRSEEEHHGCNGKCVHCGGVGGCLAGEGLRCCEWGWVESCCEAMRGVDSVPMLVEFIV